MRAALIGATGLIGGHLLTSLLNDPLFSSVRVLLRRPLELQHPKLEKKLVDFGDTESFRLALEDCEAVFCAVGTTQKKVRGDLQAYRKVDFDIPVQAARLGKLTGCRCFIVVSSIGADPASRNFYLRLKGEMEEAVTAVGIEHLHILQPSLLLGARSESRPGERLAQWLLPLVSFLLPRKYRPVKAEKVARQMLEAARLSLQGQ
jgi:uncharacterized protein YbjT (DUF2867 family)